MNKQTSLTRACAPFVATERKSSCDGGGLEQIDASSRAGQGRAGIDPSLPKSINSTAAPRTLLWSVPKVNTVKVSFCSKASPSRCDAERAKLGKEADSAGPKKLTLPFLSSVQYLHVHPSLACLTILYSSQPSTELPHATSTRSVEHPKHVS